MPLLRVGRTGEDVRDLQHRLAAVGFASPLEERGRFGGGTEAAVRAFQVARGLREDGVCGPQTWAAVVEAGYHLGDRLLYLTTPMLRGDDVAELQHLLGTLGFDPGRVDGILGENTQAALLDFQRNAGLTVDATCGPATLAALHRLSTRMTGSDHVARVRERAELRQGPSTLGGRRVVVGEPGGLNALTRSVARRLNAAGARVVTVSSPDGSELAARANQAGADVYLGLAAGDPGCRTAYYSGHGFESPGGRRLAECLQAELAPVLETPVADPVGMALPVLRETRMPAVLCELGPPSVVVSRGADLAAACGRALWCWAEGLPEL